MRKRHWTKEEVEYLENSWGTVAIDRIAKNLNRSINAVKEKAYKLGLGDPFEHYDGITISQLSQVINIHYNIIVNWAEKYDFPMKLKRLTLEKQVRVVSYDDFWKWAEPNKRMIDFSRFEQGDLGPEPDWVEEKRRADQRLKLIKPKPHNTPWSKDEISRLKHYVKAGLTYPEICDRLKRTHGAVKRRLQDLGIKYRPVYLDNHRPYTQKEIDYILDSVEKGISFEEMARHLQRSEAGVRGKLERMGYKFKNGVPYLEEKRIS